MGWLELCAWVRGMNLMNRAGDPDPERWTAASRDNFTELDQLRQKMRGR
jgi:hypothetical protein